MVTLVWRGRVPAHRFLISNLSVNSEMQLFRFQIISPEVTVEKIGKRIVNFLFPKSLWFEFHRQSRTVPACNCRGTDRRKMKVKEMPFSQICHWESSSELLNSIDRSASIDLTIHIPPDPTSQWIFDENKPFLSLFGLLFCIKGSH